MNRNNNKDLYQVIGVNKNASQDQIIKVSQELVKKDSSDEVGIASLVLSDPQKRGEYDRVGWKKEWGDEWSNRKSLVNSVFQAIHNEFWCDQEARVVDGQWRTGVHYWDLEEGPSLWAPHPADSPASWIDKCFSIVGPNWKRDLEDYRDKMIAAIRKVRAKKEKEYNSQTLEEKKVKEKYEYKEKFNCDKCGKYSEMFPYLGGKGDKYCSFECLDEAVFEPLRQYKKLICSKMPLWGWRCL